MTLKLFLAVVTPLALVLAALLYLKVVDAVSARLNRRWRARVQPWLWLLPALLLLAAFLVYPVFRTLLESFLSAGRFAGLDNYKAVFADPSSRAAVRNNLLWIVFFTAFTVGFGLLVALLTDRVRYGGLIKTILFTPMAISYVAAGVIWRFVYAYNPPLAPQTGLLNAVVVNVFDRPPVAWLLQQPLNTFALIAAGVWTVTGFCMVILSAGLRSIPGEFSQAAKVDGANAWQLFRHITFPVLLPTVAVVTTTMVVSALKVFDIVYVMTSGDYGTDVIANQIYKQLFIARDLGRASAIAVVLLVALVPFMLLNVRRFRGAA